MKSITYYKLDGGGVGTSLSNVPNRKKGKKKPPKTPKTVNDLTERQLNLYLAFNWPAFWTKKRDMPSIQTPKNGKIPRCQNAFMLMKTEVRKEARNFLSLTRKFDGVDISVVSGVAWSNSTKEQQEVFHKMFKELSEKHKKTYPDQPYHTHKQPKWNNVSEEYFSANKKSPRKQFDKGENKLPNGSSPIINSGDLIQEITHDSYNPNNPNEFFPTEPTDSSFGKFLSMDLYYNTMNEDTSVQDEMISGFQCD
ncbi:18371_t:CDS:1, partial [Acaulospora morrowiae]